MSSVTVTRGGSSWPRPDREFPRRWGNVWSPTGPTTAGRAGIGTGTPMITVVTSTLPAPGAVRSCHSSARTTAAPPSSQRWSGAAGCVRSSGLWSISQRPTRRSSQSLSPAPVRQLRSARNPPSPSLGTNPRAPASIFLYLSTPPLPHTLAFPSLITSSAPISFSRSPPPR